MLTHLAKPDHNREKALKWLRPIMRQQSLSLSPTLP